MSTPAPDREHAEEIGLRELRQHASEVVRRAEAGTEFVVTVAGRAAARLTAADLRTWCSGAELRAIFTTPPWGSDGEARDALDQSLRDPWETSR